MSKDSHPYFVANDPDRKTTATLLTGTAAEFGIDQHDIQVTRGGFNVTRAIAEAIYGADFDADDDANDDGADFDADDDDADDEGEVDADDDATESTSQHLNPGEPIVTGSPKSGDATTATPVAPEADEEPEEPDTEPVAPEHQDHDDVNYAEWDYADLKQAITTRGIETEDRRGETYVAALIADDKAREDADDDDEPETV